MMAKLDAHHEGTGASLNSGREETTACQEATEAYPEEIEHEASHEKVPKEEAGVKSVGALKKRQSWRHPAAGRRGKPKERIQGNGGSRKKLAATRR
jgi:hypothetical protein